MRDALLAQREILRRLPLDYTVPEAQALELLQSLVRDFTPEEFRALDHAGAMDWRFVEGEKRYIRSFAETLLATHPELAARQIDPPQQHPSWERYEPEHEQMVRTGAVSADITLETSIGMSDAAFAAALCTAAGLGIPVRWAGRCLAWVLGAPVRLARQWVLRPLAARHAARRAARKERRNAKRTAKNPKKNLPNQRRVLYNSNVSK